MYEIPFHSKSLNNYRFLVTGGAGFIGSNIVEYLLKYEAKEVRVLDNLSNGNLGNLKIFGNNPRLHFIEGDITNLETCQKACKNIDIVLQQAALGSVPRSIANPIGTNEANVVGFLNMLVAAKDQNVKRFVYAGSSSTYGDSPSLPKKEDIIGRPLSPYAVTKYVNELYADVFAKTYQMEIIGLRYFNVFGPRQNPKVAYAAVIPLMMDSLKNNTPFYINGKGEQTRDFTFVENVVQANILAALTQNPDALNQVYNVAVGEATSLNQLYKILQNISGNSLPPIYREERQGDIQNSLADISKAQTLLNYQPQIKIEQGLKIAWEKFLKNY
jgi:UDP-N-acetylglucosamine 4-epimerase